MCSQLRKIFGGLRKAAGVPIAPKDLRTSFGQILMDAGATMDQCSVQLRHFSVATTQKWYVELRPEGTFDQLKRLFQGQNQAKPSEKNKSADFDLAYRR